MCKNGRIARNVFLAALAVAAQVGCGSSSKPSPDNSYKGLAATPPMGFNDWNSFGCNVSEALIKETADFLVESGLKDAGYVYVNIDDCWQVAGTEADPQSGRVDGKLVADPVKFPRGMKWLADYVHSKGLKLGIYESAGNNTCQRIYPGSYGYETVDAQLFADWGIDYLKYDNCGTTDEMTKDQATYIARYTRMADALKATGRDIVYSLCEWGQSDPWTWGGAISQLWRTTGDISDSYSSMLGIVEQNAILAQYAKPGAWNDPDMLEVGNGGMTTIEYRSHFSLWAIMAAPLIIGTDLRVASAETLAILSNKDVIAVDQDSLGKQGALLTSDGRHYVFAKPLANGDVAVALFNSTSVAATLATDTAAVGLTAGKDYQLKDLWSKDVTETAGAISAFVPPHGTAMYRISPSASILTSTASNVMLSVSSAASQIAVGGSVTLTVSLTNNGTNAISGAALSLTVPDGWSATLTSAGLSADLASQATSTVTYQVTAPATTTELILSVAVDAEVVYASVAGPGYVLSEQNLTLFSPVDTAYLTTDQSGEGSAIFAQSGEAFGVEAAGSGVSPASSNPFGDVAATDQFASIYKADALDSVSSSWTVEVTVESFIASAGGFGRSSGQSGLIVRNDMTGAPDSGAGVVMYIDSRGNINMAWNASSTAGDVDTSASTAPPGPPSSSTVTYSAPIKLRLTRTGTTFVGSYATSADSGATWSAFTDLATAAVPTAATTQDAGVYHASGTTGGLDLATFSQLTITGS